ncbi:hypothetical protein SPONN_1023 [uncultured Candidatus Thioglobus sp.]|nr:hypothetical protein SPONN_1023 [uncultured Candidatus Thioglobus sp.]
MEAITIQKTELKELIKASVSESLAEYLPKLDLSFKQEWKQEAENRVNAYDGNKIKSIAEKQVFAEYES